MKTAKVTTLNLHCCYIVNWKQKKTPETVISLAFLNFCLSIMGITFALNSQLVKVLRTFFNHYIVITRNPTPNPSNF